MKVKKMIARYNDNMFTNILAYLVFESQHVETQLISPEIMGCRLKIVKLDNLYCHYQFLSKFINLITKCELNILLLAKSCNPCFE